MKYFSRHSFGRVVEEGTKDVTVVNLDGIKWSVSREIFDEEFDLSGEHSAVEEKTKTEISDIVSHNPYTIMTVTFNKQVKEKDVKKKLYDLYMNKGSIISELEFRDKCDQILNEVLKGEERVLIGYHTGKTDHAGRLYFFDMETKGKDNKPEFRLVDLRTISCVIVRDVKYCCE